MIITAVCAGAARATHLAWNHDEIRAVIAQAPGVVAVALSGHDHMGGYALVEGVHYVTLEAMLEGNTLQLLVLCVSQCCKALCDQ